MTASPEAPDSQGSRPLAVGLALFVVFLWATSWVLIKFGLEEIPALTFAGLRYMIAFLSLLPFAVWTQRKTSTPAIPRQAWKQLIFLGLLLYAVTQGAVFLALDYLPVVTVNLLWSFSSITVALFGIIWLSEHPTRFQWFGIGLATLGVLIYFFPINLPAAFLVGFLVSAIGVLANAGAVILGRSVNRSRLVHPLVVTAVSMGVGAAALLAVGVITQGLPSISAQGWAIIIWLAIINTAFAFTLWNFTLRTLSATESSIINGSMLIWIPILAVVFLDETISTMELIGLIIAGVGTLIVQLRQPGFFKRLLAAARGK
jgi:drug/metabolite transporter (DMT)-like permease